jgi:hypothetical protein
MRPYWGGPRFGRLALGSVRVDYGAVRPGLVVAVLLAAPPTDRTHAPGTSLEVRASEGQCRRGAAYCTRGGIPGGAHGIAG